VITDGIHGYVSRDFRAARDAKDLYWAARIERLGPAEGLRIAEELRRQVLHQNPEWPGVVARDADLLAHTRLAELLRRGGRPRRG
jgi:hypothetical protein